MLNSVPRSSCWQHSRCSPASCTRRWSRWVPACSFRRQAEGSLIRDGAAIAAPRSSGSRSVAPAISGAARRPPAPAYNAAAFLRIQPRPQQPGAGPGGGRSRRRTPCRRSDEHGTDARGPRHRLGQRPRSRSHAGGGGVPGRARRARPAGCPEAQVQQLVAAHTEGRTFGILGEPRVNVVLLNLALDQAQR